MRSSERYEDVYYLPPDSALRWFSLGHDSAFADLIWMRALVYYGDELSHSGDLRFVFDYADAICTLDPDFRATYLWAGTAGMYRPGDVTPHDIERTIDFLERGARRFPDDGELAWELGAALVFELAPRIDDPEVKDRIRERGIPHLMRAIRLGAAPPWASLTSASLLDRIGHSEQAAAHLEETILSVDDPALRARMQRHISDLRARAQRSADAAASDALEAERQRNFPYLTPGLYVLVGARPVVDVTSPMRDGLSSALAGE